MRTALVVEDDEFSMRVFDHVLRRKGLLPIAARNAAEAVAFARSGGWRFDLLVCDVRLPDERGTKVAVEFASEQPGIPILFSSGTPVEGWTKDERSDMEQLPGDTFDFLPKPFHVKDLELMLTELLGESGDQWTAPRSTSNEHRLAA